MEKFLLKITSAVALNGMIHKAGSVVEVAESVAKDLPRRGRAVIVEIAEAVEHVVAEDTEGSDKPADEPSDDAAPKSKGKASK